MHSQLSFSSSYIWYIFFQPYKTFFLLIFPYNFRVSLRLIKPLVRSKDDILLFCRSCQREKCTLVYRSISSFNVKMEVVRTYETLANFCPNACVCRDVREKYFLHTHARIHTQTHIHKHTQTHTHTHTHTPSHPPTPAYIHRHTQNSKFARREYGSKSSTGKNILNITQGNVAVFRRRARNYIQIETWGGFVGPSGRFFDRPVLRHICGKFT